MTLNLIASTCAANGGVVCSQAQIDAFPGRSLPCGLATTTRVWTSTPCVNSKSPTAQAFVVTLGSGSDSNPQCSLTGTQSHGLVCCHASSASPTFSTLNPSSPVPTANPTQSSTSSTLAPSSPTSTSSPPALLSTAQPVASVQTLAPTSPPSPTVACPLCPFSTAPCQAGVDYTTAAQTCSALGARLCTESELQSPPMKTSYPCQLSTTRVWSSTPCVNAKNPSGQAFYVVLGSGGDSSPQCSQTTSAQQHGLLCCGGAAAPSLPPPTMAPTNLFFVPGPTCVGLSLFSDAETYCSSQNGRLCTQAEMMQGKSGLGCQVDGQRAWTSTTCTNPKAPSAPAYMVVLAQGNDPSPQCSQIVSQTKAVVCCALPRALITPTVAPVEYESVTPVPTTAASLGNLTSPLPLPRAAQLTQPMAKNVIMLIADDMKPVISSYGDTYAITPNIDRIAARGVRFSRAYTQYAECAPSRSSFLTGLRPDTIQVYDLSTNMRAVVKSAVTIPMMFKASGYYTVAMGKIFDDRATYDEDQPTGCWSENPAYSNNNTACYDQRRPVCVQPGWDSTKCKCMDNPAFLFGASAFPSIQNGTIGNGPIMTETSYVDGRMGNYGASKLTWLMNRPTGSPPFFFALGLWKPHLPFIAPSQYFEMFDMNSIPLPAYPFAPEGPTNPYTNYPPPGELASQYTGNTGSQPKPLILAYRACVAFIDHQIGKILDAFEAGPQSVQDDTLILFLSDHGFHLGDHNLWTKHTNYEQATRIPLIIAPPSGVGRPTEWRSSLHAGKVSRAPVELVDLMATLMDLTGLVQLNGQYSDPTMSFGMGHQEGMSLRPLLTNQQSYVQAFALSQYWRPGNYMGYAVRSTRYRYVRWIPMPGTSGSVYEELYDLGLDPLETRNVYNAANYSQAHNSLIGYFNAYYNNKPYPVIPFDDGQSNEDASMLFSLTPPTPAPAGSPTAQPQPLECDGCYLIALAASVSGLASLLQQPYSESVLSQALSLALQDMLSERQLAFTTNVIARTIGGSSGVAFNITGLPEPQAALLVELIVLDQVFLKYALGLRIKAVLMDRAGVFPSQLGTITVTQFPQILPDFPATSASPSSAPTTHPTTTSPSTFKPGTTPVTSAPAPVQPTQPTVSHSPVTLAQPTTMPGANLPPTTTASPHSGGQGAHAFGFATMLLCSVLAMVGTTVVK